MQQAAFTEADKKRVKVVNFVAKWLNLYPHTVHYCNHKAFTGIGGSKIYLQTLNYFCILSRFNQVTFVHVQRI